MQAGGSKTTNGVCGGTSPRFNKLQNSQIQIQTHRRTLQDKGNPHMKSKLQKGHQRSQKPQLCPQFRALGEFFGKIKVASDDEQGKDTMLLESKLQKILVQTLEPQLSPQLCIARDIKIQF